MTIPKVPQEGETLAPANYTVAQVNADILDIVLSNPNNVNPVNNRGKCLYFKGGDPYSPAERCLVGTWLHERGHEYNPEWDKTITSATDITSTFGYPEAVRFRLSKLQGKADNGTHPVPWKNLLVLVETPEDEY